MPKSRMAYPPSGQDLAALRHEASLTQTELTQAAGLTRYSVGRLEQKAVIDVKQPTPLRLMEVLTPPKRPISGHVRAGATLWGSTRSATADERGAPALGLPGRVRQGAVRVQPQSSRPATSVSRLVPVNGATRLAVGS
jgi:hypothetical protein